VAVNNQKRVLTALLHALGITLGKAVGLLVDLSMCAILNGGPDARSSGKRCSIGADMPKGTVKWFNSQKGYGFIQPQGGSRDVFVHISAVERAGLSSLNEGQVVEYEEVANKGKTSAENLRVQR
jgi:cold shock protein